MSFERETTVPIIPTVDPPLPMHQMLTILGNLKGKESTAGTADVSEGL